MAARRLDEAPFHAADVASFTPMACDQAHALNSRRAFRGEDRTDSPDFQALPKM
jgi:hypothetical protein